MLYGLVLLKKVMTTDEITTINALWNSKLVW